MKFFKGELEAGKEVKIPFETSRLTLSNLGSEDLHYNFGAPAGEGLQLLAKTGRSLKFGASKVDLHVVSEKGTTLQVDTLDGSIFQVGAALVSGGTGGDKEPPKPKELVASPYFPLPMYDDYGVKYDNFLISRQGGPFYEAALFSGPLIKDGTSLIAKGDYITYSASGFDTSWTWPSESTDYFGWDNGEIYAVGGDLRNEEDNSVVRRKTKFATWNDNKHVEGFSPKHYLNMPVINYHTFVLFRDGDTVKLVYPKGELTYEAGVLSSEEIGYRSFLFTDGEYVEDEDNIFAAFSVEVALEDIIEVGKDLKNYDLKVVKERVALGAIN